MSFGALSRNAIRALNGGAKKGNFAHDTGEGGYSPYHRENGGDIIWEIGSGYFCCRNARRHVLRREIRRRRDATIRSRWSSSNSARAPSPAMAACCPAPRSVPRSPPPAACRSASTASRRRGIRRFRRPIEMMQFIATMRRLSGGKPAGFKLCIGHPWEFLAICKAMLETEIYPDFIVVDGKEGGTGAAPLEFADHLGMPLREGLTFVHNALVGINARDRIKLGASGKIISRLRHRARHWRSAPTGAIRRAASCSRWAASSRSPATPTAARPACRRRIRRASARWWCPTRPSASTISTAPRSSRLPSWSRRRASIIRREFAPAHFSRRVSQHEVKSFAELYPPLSPGELLAGSSATSATRWPGHGEREGIPGAAAGGLSRNLTCRITAKAQQSADGRQDPNKNTAGRISCAFSS